jgi:predicted GNAT family acetyltransferase
MQRALEVMQELLYDAFDGARFERRSDLIVLVCPGLPIPQFNGAWVVEDSRVAVEALAEAVAEVEATGAWPWLQTRSGHDRTRQQALNLGLTQSMRLPGMVVEPGDLVEPAVEIDIGLVRDGDVDATNQMLSISFEAPKELFDTLCGVLRSVEEASWYVGRVEDAIVSTAVGVTVDGATGVFNVATPPEHRGRGYGAALTSRVVRDGFGAGSRFAFLQSSEIGHGVYRRLGFRDVEQYVLLTRPT